ncbi:MAG: peptidylprolyl isomerase [Planctomycetota bacterium]
MPDSIAKDAVVTIHYQLTLDDGTIADSSFGGEPLAYLHGHGNLVPGLERQLVGRKSGDTLEAVVPAAEGYGEFDPAAEQALPRSAFPKDVDLQPGMGFHTEDDHGNVVPLFVKQVGEQEVVVTQNHPLAGQRLNFKIEVLKVRKATKDELAHGHVHGPGGHHH